MTVEGVPSYTEDADITITGKAGPSETVTVRLNDKTLGKATAKADGSFSLRVTLAQEGEHTLAVMTESAEKMLSVRYQKPAAKLAITGPEETTFTGTNIVVRGETEPEATVYVETEGYKTNVKAGRNGAFSVRLYMDAGTVTYTLRSKATGFADSYAQITLTRELTEREWIAEFRKSMIEPKYDVLAQRCEEFVGKHIVERGIVVEFADYDGSPCALVCTDNPSKGVWTDPVWVIMDKDDEIREGDIVTMYLVCEGLSLPAEDKYYAGGAAEYEAPVLRLAHWTTAK